MNYGMNYQPYPTMNMASYPQVGYSPYSNYVASQPMQQNVQPQIPPSSIQPNEPTIQLCDSADFVKSQNTRLDGGLSVFMLTDGSAMYCKKLNPVNGMGVTLKYELVQDTSVSQIDAFTSNENSQSVTMLSQLQADITEMKNMLLDSLTTPKGGDGK